MVEEEEEEEVEEAEAAEVEVVIMQNLKKGTMEAAAVEGQSERLSD